MKNHWGVRAAGFVLFALLSMYIMNYQEHLTLIPTLSAEQNHWLIVGLSGVVGFFLLPWLTVKPIEKVRNASLTHLVLTILGLMLGLICAALISGPMSQLPGIIGTYGPMFCVIFFCLLSVAINLVKMSEFTLLANRITNGKFQASEVAAQREKNILLDTSVIIDGRISDIAHTGFLPGVLLIPRFILQELQYIADSEDAQRRQRGRRGLEILAELQKEPNVTVRISDFEVDGVREVDSKLVVLARQLNCPILTNDYNLNKVADLQGVAILNVNDLANAVKSVLLPGEELRINVIQEGKEQNQGVGYMEDGTMVVIENGRCYLNHEINAVVTKVLQTTAGRMIFARHEKEIGVKR